MPKDLASDIVQCITFFLHPSRNDAIVKKRRFIHVRHHTYCGSRS